MATAAAAADVLAPAPADLDAPYAVTPEQIARFQRDGYIKLKDVLSAETLARYQPTFARLVDERRNRDPIEKRGTYGKAFQQVINLWRIDAVAKQFAFSRRLARIAAELMGVGGVRMYHDQALCKEAGGGFTPWHCDQVYWPLEQPTTVTAWIPFQAVPVEMGPLSFAAGSHRADFGRGLTIGDESERIIAKKITDLHLEESAFDLGEVSFHYGYTFHRAPPNRTDRMRWVMTVIYMEDGIRLRASENESQENDRKGFCPGAVVGQPVATEMNPKLY